MIKKSIIKSTVYTTETIAAIATPVGRGGIGILRISGNLSTMVAKKILGIIPPKRQALYLPFLGKNNIVLDKGIALFFESPNSFTGEDILELQGHGSPIVLDMLLKRITSLPNIRIARPGEFLERAFLNNKLDLTQAESIADLINANSNQAAKAAINSMQGMFSFHINELIKLIINLRTYIEASIDFSNEEINFLSNNKIKLNLKKIIIKINEIKKKSHQGILLQEIIKIVIVGKPNVGKSSLINLLAEKEIAIVDKVKGTTRDVLRENIQIDGINLQIIDTAGLRKTNNIVEQIGVKKTWNEIKHADHILLIVDSTDVSFQETDLIWSKFVKKILFNIPTTIIRNKIDLTRENVGIYKKKNYSVINLSVKNNIGINLIFKHLKKSIGLIGSIEGNFIARRRHLNSIKIIYQHILNSIKYININSYELLAEELKLAHKELNTITGEFTSNDLINNIFSNFCVGK